VLKLSNKISKLSAYFVLLGYLTIITSYVLHHHNVDLGKSNSSLVSLEKKQNNHYNFYGSEVLCLVQFAYNSLHNSLLSFNNPIQECQNKPEIVDLISVSSKPKKEKIFSFCLRAPPLSIS